MTEVFANRARALEQHSSPTFSTNATWNAGVWNAKKYNSLEGYLASDRSAAVTLYQGNISGTWDWSKTFRVNNPSSSLIIADIGVPLRAQFINISVQGTSGDTPTAAGFRLVTYGKTAGQDDVSISGQSVLAWISGAVTVLQSGAVKVLQSGAVTVLASGPVPVNLSGQELKVWTSGGVTVLQSGAVTVLVSGPLVTRNSGEAAVVGNYLDTTSGGLRLIRTEASGEVVVRFSGEIVKVWESGAVTVLQSGAVTVLVSGLINLPVLVSGPLPVNLSGQSLVISGAVTVLVSGPLRVTNTDGIFTVPTHTPVAVLASSTQALATNLSGMYRLFVNDSDTTIYVKLSGTAAVNDGIRLNAAGGSYEMSKNLGNLYQGAVNAICATSSKVLLVTEGI